MPEKTIREAIAEAMAEEMRRDPNVILIGEDVGKFGGAMGASKGLFDEFGEGRVIDTPISEAAIIGSGLGMALTGQRPIAELMFVDFSGVCMDQILNQVAKVRYMLGGQPKVPLVIRASCGGGRSGYAAQHSQSLEAWFTHVPGLKVVMPATARDAKGLLKSAIRDDNPVMFLEHKLLYNNKGDVPGPDPDFTIPLGKAEIKREGTDITIASHSRQLLHSLEAAAELAKKGIEAEVIRHAHIASDGFRRHSSQCGEDQPLRLRGRGLSAVRNCRGSGGKGRREVLRVARHAAHPHQRQGYTHSLCARAGK